MIFNVIQNIEFKLIKEYLIYVKYTVNLVIFKFLDYLFAKNINYYRKQNR